MHQQGENTETNGLGQDADGEEGEVLAEPASMFCTAKGPQPVELEVPQVGDEERDRRVDVIPADIEVGERQIEEDAVLVGTDFLAHDRDEQVHENARCANEAEPEELLPVVPVTYQEVVLQAFHNRKTIPTCFV